MVRNTWRLAIVAVVVLVTLAGVFCVLDREASGGERGMDLCALPIAVAGLGTLHPVLALMGRAEPRLAPLLHAAPLRGIDPPPRSRPLPA